MIWSVSVSLMGSGARLPLNIVIGSMLVGHLHQFTRVGDDAADRRCDCREWAGEERAPAFALPPFKIAIAGADGVLPRLQLVTVHGDAHRAARLAPFRPCLAENLVQPFGFGLNLYLM